MMGRPTRTRDSYGTRRTTAAGSSDDVDED